MNSANLVRSSKVSYVTMVVNLSQFGVHQFGSDILELIEHSGGEQLIEVISGFVNRFLSMYLHRNVLRLIVTCLIN